MNSDAPEVFLFQRRTDNAVAKRKKTNNGLQNTTYKSKY